MNQSMLETILDPPTPPSKRSRKRTTYGTLGQFRVLTVQDGPPCLQLCLDHPEMVAEAWRKQVATSPWFDPDKEHMVVFVVNSRLVLKGWNLVSVGSVNETTCHPREVLRPVLVAAGYGFVVAHNHPSGDPSPSHADRAVTTRILEAAAIMQVSLLDHVIIGSNDRHFSFREAGTI